jgi:hypothetical protein
MDHYILLWSQHTIHSRKANLLQHINELEEASRDLKVSGHWLASQASVEYWSFVYHAYALLDYFGSWAQRSYDSYCGYE